MRNDNPDVSEGLATRSPRRAQSRRRPEGRRHSRSGATPTSPPYRARSDP